jgi:hypothetical protein
MQILHSFPKYTTTVFIPWGHYDSVGLKSTMDMLKCLTPFYQQFYSIALPIHKHLTDKLLNQNVDFTYECKYDRSSIN